MLKQIGLKLWERAFRKIGVHKQAAGAAPRTFSKMHRIPWQSAWRLRIKSFEHFLLSEDGLLHLF